MASIKQGLVWSVVAFSVALAVVIGIRLEQAALAVVVGVACGVGASVPAGVLVVLLLRRKDQNSDQRGARAYSRGVQGTPPVVVVAPPAAQQLPAPAGWQAAFGAPVSNQREFAVIGEEDAENGFNFWQAYS
jgi:hypothetical protein